MLLNAYAGVSVGNALVQEAALVQAALSQRDVDAPRPRQKGGPLHQISVVIRPHRRHLDDDSRQISHAVPRAAGAGVSHGGGAAAVAAGLLPPAAEAEDRGSAAGRRRPRPSVARTRYSRGRRVAYAAALVLKVRGGRLQHGQQPHQGRRLERLLPPLGARRVAAGRRCRDCRRHCRVRLGQPPGGGRARAGQRLGRPESSSLTPNLGHPPSAAAAAARPAATAAAATAATRRLQQDYAGGVGRADPVQISQPPRLAAPRVQLDLDPFHRLHQLRVQRLLGKVGQQDNGAPVERRGRVGARGRQLAQEGDGQGGPAG
jgi:hypothetical protein